VGGIYIHIPFCKRRCSYCDFYSVGSLERRHELLECLHRELELRAASADGGGTPTVYSPSELQSLADTVKRLRMVRCIEEYTVEANPDDLLNDNYLADLRSTEARRLSIGIQSFIDRDLLLMKRRHTGDEAEISVRKAQKAGFENISIDLIYGFPGMSLSEWGDNLNRALALGVQHVSAYHLTIENGTLLGLRVKRGELIPIDEDASAEQYLLLIDTMRANGFRQYEASNFALPGYESRHNSSYWRREAYLGVGPSAHGYDGFYLRRKNEANLIRYIEAIRENRIPEEVEILSEIDLYNERVMTSLRTDLGLDTKTLPANFAHSFISKSRRYLRLGLLQEHDGVYSIPSKHLFVMDGIIADLFMNYEL
jgi:oxygen-independent coproporphyrinogen-3 oxidase